MNWSSFGRAKTESLARVSYYQLLHHSTIAPLVLTSQHPLTTQAHNVFPVRTAGGRLLVVLFMVALLSTLQPYRAHKGLLDGIANHIL
jgi:hypothetical protein